MNKELLGDPRSQELQKLLDELRDEYGLSYEEIIEFVVKEVEIPLEIFNKNLSSLEAISKYLIENLKFGQKAIALLTNRSQKTIWQAYNSQKKKYPRKIIVKNKKPSFPLSILRNRKLSVLESIVLYLRDSLKLTNHQIAHLLKRNYKTVWTVYHRAKIKLKK